MSRIRARLSDRTGSAATELALVTPLLLIIMMGSAELGNYFYNEHALRKGLRDGARYAARQSFTNYATCTGSPSPAIVANTKALVRTGQLSGGTDRLPNWTHATTTFTMEISCVTTVATGPSTSETMTGIYRNNAGGAPRVRVSASLPYQPILASYGFRGVGARLNAAEQAAVAGI